MTLKVFVLKRIFLIVMVVFFGIALNFTLMHLMPGDPVIALIGKGAYAPPEYIEKIREIYGLNKPLYEQFVIYIEKILMGDFGYSWNYRQNVLEVIAERIPYTLVLLVTQLTLATVFGVLIGAFASRKTNSRFTSIADFVSLTFYSMPVFWTGTIYLLVFALYLGWFPLGGFSSIGTHASIFEYILDVLYHLALPVLSLGSYQFAVMYRITKLKMVEVSSQDFVVTARAKGCDQRTVFQKHILKNASIPLITMVGLEIGYMFSGAVLTESVFGIPGMGRLMLDSISARDYPLIMGSFIVLSLLVAVLAVITDIIYAVVDPRIRYWK
jgi:peptide/nickel transport system permease protein